MFVPEDNLPAVRMRVKADLKDVVSGKAAAHLRSFKRDVERLLPDQVSNVVLFGSRARGDPRQDSDYDVAVFVKNMEDRRQIDHTITDAAYRHIVAGVHIRPVSLPDDFLERQFPGLLARDIERDGIVIP
jgi:predicted nucleotidyltransferase